MGEGAIRRSGGAGAPLCALFSLRCPLSACVELHSFLDKRGGQCLLIAPMIARLFQYLFSVHSLLFSGCRGNMCLAIFHIYLM